MALRDLPAGTEFLHRYNVGAPDDPWDPVWNFECACGAANCQGAIDRYRPE